MNGWLIYQREDAKVNQTYIDWFQDEAKTMDIDIQVIYRETMSIGIVHGKYCILIDGKKIELPDFIVNRSIEPFLQQFFSAQGVSVFNDAQTANIANHKAQTHLSLHTIGVPMMPSFFIHGRALPDNPPFPYPLIVKTATGRGGQEVYFIEHNEDWEAFKQSIEHRDYVIQSTDVQLGKDVRVFIIGKEIVAAVLRSNDHDFRANFKLGGKATLYHLSKAETTMIQRICDHFNFGLVGIDFLLDHNDNLIFNEIEDVVGSRILSEVSDINLLKMYVTFIANEVRDKAK